MKGKHERPLLTMPVGLRDHMQGKASAPVTLVEYGDYECPYCLKAYPIVKKIQGRLGSNLRFVFRNFPLSQTHPHAQAAAEAAEIAATQDKFWEMHDYLFEHQDELDDAGLKRHAAALGLDTASFNHDLDRHTQAPRVREDFLSGVRSGVNGTPTFFINGIRHDGRWEFGPLMSALSKAIDGED
jgi:protein-disulfide isomerase